MNKEIIEKLKNNLAKYSNLPREEQKVFEDVGIENCQTLGNDGQWLCLGSPGNPFISVYRYRIKPNYQPEEAKIEQCEVSETIDGILIYHRGHRTSRRLYQALADPDFIVAEYDGGNRTSTLLRIAKGDSYKPALIPEYLLFRKRT